MLEMPSWLASYLNGSHVHDEVEHHCGGDTTHWDVLFARLANLTEKDIHLRSNEIKRLLQDSGVTHTGAQSSWRLDPMPLMLSECDWQIIQDGVKQRTQLLIRTAQDIYGSQQLMLNGILDARAIQSSPLYIREKNSFAPNANPIFIAAFDIYRDADGLFKVKSDHLQSPQGLGLLLENRIIARRVMGDEFAECNVQRIANFFNKFQQNINDLTTGLRDPRVVILSKGPDDPYYSEHAFLSSYMGYTLVNSADLTVRKGKVWLKSLKGLRKVDVIVRWLADNVLDSLEQTDYSIDGIPGLFQAIREGSVHIVNPVGCGILETPQVKSKLEQISQYFDRQSLILPEAQPSPLTAADLDNLLPNLADYQIGRFSDAEFMLDGEGQAENIMSLFDGLSSEQMADYYYLKKAKYSSAPFWDDHNLVAQPIVMRCFTLVSGNNIEVLPSALCFSATGIKSTPTAGWIKDTWIRSNTPQTSIRTLPKLTKEMSDLALLDGVIPSRTAENLYWLGRYLERGENTVRMLRVLIDRFTEFAIYPDSNNKAIVSRLVEAVVNQAVVFPYAEQNISQSETQSYIPREIAIQLFADQEFSGSLINTLKALKNSALQVRELLSLDSWRIIDDINDEIRRIAKSPASASTRVMQATIDRIIGFLMAFNGSTSDSMANSNGWFMLDIGRRVERSTQIASVCQHLLGQSLSEIEQLSMLEAVLSTQVSLITHKRRYRMYQSTETGLELLILDGDYPRSLLYQVEQLAQLCKFLPDNSARGMLPAHAKLLLKMQTQCHLADRETLALATEGQRIELIELMQSVKVSLERFGDMLLLQYFSHTKTATPLNSMFGSIDKS